MNYDMQCQLLAEGFKHEQINEDIIEEARIRPAAIAIAVSIVGSLIAGGIIRDNKKNAYNQALTDAIMQQSSQRDIASGKTQFMFDGHNFNYDANSNTLKMDGHKIKSKKIASKTPFNNKSERAMNTAINNARYSPEVASLQNKFAKETGYDCSISYNSGSNTVDINVGSNSGATEMSNIRNWFSKNGYKEVKTKGKTISFQKTSKYFNY